MIGKLDIVMLRHSIMRDKVNQVTFKLHTYHYSGIQTIVDSSISARLEVIEPRNLLSSSNKGFITYTSERGFCPDRVTKY